MYSAVIAFLAGNLTFPLLADPPDRWWGLGLVAVAPALVLAPRLRLPAWGLAGFLWTLTWTWPGFPLQLPQALETADLRVEGWVASIPKKTYRRIRFELRVDTLRHGDTPIPFTGKLDLSWYDTPPPLRVGDKWRLSVRLKRPRGMANPGGSDYERWLFVKGIAARGYVRPQPPPRRLVQAARYPIDRYRQQLVERFSRLLPGNPYSGILTALAVGDRQYIQTWQWEVFTSTAAASQVNGNTTAPTIILNEASSL